MPAGMELFTNEGRRIIDQNYRNYFLLRTVSVVCSSPTFQFSNRAWTGTAAFNNGEIVAIHSASPCAYVRVSNGQVTVVTTAGQGAVVTLFFFGPLAFSDATWGLQTFHPDTQQLIFCGSKKPMRLAGIAAGYGEFTYTPNRIYAVVMLQQYYRYRYTSLNNPPSPYLRQWNSERSMVRVGTNGVAVEKVVEINHADNIAAPSENVIIDSGAAFTPRHLVIDVTNY